MERTTRITEAKQILGNYFIGPEELSEISAHMGISLQNNYPEIRYSKKELIEKKDNYLLILGATHMKDGSLLTLKTLRDFFGINPELSEPCFYNQDWYMNENFIENPLENRWYLIRRNIFEESRGKNPEDLMPKYELPKAIICAFTFFSNYFANQGEIL